MKIINTTSEKNLDKKTKLTPLIRCLIECEKGEQVVILRVDAGFKAKKRLANLGIIPGVPIIKKKSAPLKGPIEIIVKGSSLVIGRGIAAKIMVKCSGRCKV